MVVNMILKQCAICEKSFMPKTVSSIYCSKKCSDTAYRERKREQKKEERRKAIASRIPDNRKYISVPETVILFGVAKTTLHFRIYRFICSH